MSGGRWEGGGEWGANSKTGIFVEAQGKGKEAGKKPVTRLCNPHREDVYGSNSGEGETRRSGRRASQDERRAKAGSRLRGAS